MHKIALYFMFIHRENALKAHQHISYCSIYTCHFKKKILIQNLIKRFTKTHQIAHLKKNSRRVACSLAYVKLISLFLYKKNIFSFRMQSQYTPKRINYDMFSPKKFREL